MSDIIQLLPDSVANQIAAGEVIQRPASVVKELVENAIDAGADNIKIIVKDAGRTSIQLTDNGMGMSETDARLAFERHATSKIRKAEDLFNIQTKGFRGEALASIAAIAQVELKTKQHDSEIGNRIEIHGSEVVTQQPVASNTGSTFIVKNLFYNVPARRKFLKSNSTELKHIITEFQRVALTHEEIEFELIHNDVTIHHLPKSNTRQRIVHMFGKGINQNLTTLNTQTSLARITGFVGKPEFARKTTGEQFFFVNNRYMRHPYFHRAVMKAYEKILMPETYPSYFIYLESDPKTIDINIHPTKTEIKFEDEQALFQIIHASVKEAIGKFNIAPSIDFETEGVVDIPVMTGKEDLRMPEIKINPEYNPFKEDRRNVSQNKYPGSDYSGGKKIENWEQFYDGFVKSGSEPEVHHIEKEETKTKPSETAEELYSGFLQLKKKYILTAVKSGLMVIDQKRAHERILYESLVRNMALNNISQKTLYPVNIELSSGNSVIMDEILEELKVVGFMIEKENKGTYKITGIPDYVEGQELQAVIESMIEDYQSSGNDVKSSVKNRLAESLAKSIAIPYGRILSQDEMQKLTDSLFGCEEPGYSPGGKPVIAMIQQAELEKMLI